VWHNEKIALQFTPRQCGVKGLGIRWWYNWWGEAADEPPPPGFGALKPARGDARPTESWNMDFPSTAMLNLSTPAVLFARLGSWMETSATFSFLKTREPSL